MSTAKCEAKVKQVIDLRKLFEEWQLSEGYTDPMWLSFADGRYGLNEVQHEWEKFQEVARIVIRECIETARQNGRFGPMLGGDDAQSPQVGLSGHA